MLTIIAATVTTDGHRRVNPSVYLRPTDQTTSSKPATTSKIQFMAPLWTLRHGHELAVLRPRVIRGGPDDLAVLALFDHVGAPARHARHHEQRREHRGGHAHEVVAHRAEPVEVREHLL